MLNRSQANTFLENILRDMNDAGIDSESFLFDHICYRTSSYEEYEGAKNLVLSGVGSMLRGDQLGEGVINGRPIATYRLHEPLVIGKHYVESLEIPAPKPGADFQTGFEHLEVVAPISFQDFKANYPHLTYNDSATSKVFNPELAVKFSSGTLKIHHLPLSCIIAIENRPEIFNLLVNDGLLDLLANWTPLLSGSMPLEVDIERSDLDILLHAESLEGVERAISQKLTSLNLNLSWKRVEARQGTCLLGTIDRDGISIEFFVSTIPVLEQDSHRHLLSEYYHLVKNGPAMRRTIIERKREGLTTEQAFAKVLKLPGDPYEALLKYV